MKGGIHMNNVKVLRIASITLSLTASLLMHAAKYMNEVKNK